MPSRGLTIWWHTAAHWAVRLSRIDGAVQRDLVNLEGEIVARSNHLKFLLGRLNGDP